MKIRKHTWIIGFAGLIFLLAAFILFKNGILVTPTEKSLALSQEIPVFDILEWQYNREFEIIEDYKAGYYTFERPYIIVDPYEMNPLAALVIFEDQQAGEIQVVVQGKDEFATYTYSKSSESTHFEIPILGLYAGKNNMIHLTNPLGKTVELYIETEPLPVDFQTYQLIESHPEKMEPGITLFTACFEDSYTALLDHNADVRGYLSNQYMAHGTSMILLNNGNMLSTGDEYKQIPYHMTSLWEFNWLGKVFREYEIPNAVHHDISELPNGDILAVSNNKDMFDSGTREDVVIIIDRNSGEVKKEYDFRKILDEERDPYTHFHPNILNVANIDWMHTNAAIYIAEDNQLIVSSPIQSQVVAIDASTSEIRWILGPHEGYDGPAKELQQYLLSPIGSDFEWAWAQHAPMLLPDFDQNPDTLDLMLFDNGQARSFFEDTSISPDENYSRAVHYRINQELKTVEQIWQAGKECGSDCYATFLGDADYLPATGNRLITFGGQLRANGAPVDDIVEGVLGNVVVNSKVMEVKEKGDIVFSVDIRENDYTQNSETYQAERIALFSPLSFNYQIGEIHGKRLGESYVCATTDFIQAPPLYTRNLQVIFDRKVMEGDRLIVDGRFLINGQSYFLGRAFFILRSKENTYIYSSNNALNSRFFMSLDTSELAPGTYQLSIVAAAREGNDQLNGKLYQGHVKTPYKIVVN